MSGESPKNHRKITKKSPKNHQKISQICSRITKKSPKNQQQITKKLEMGGQTSCYSATLRYYSASFNAPVLGNTSSCFGDEAIAIALSLCLLGLGFRASVGFEVHVNSNTNRLKPL